MKREEKNQLTKHRIFDSAFQEFAEKGYAEASMNAICADGKLSKGIIYHYFQDKDALYLACLRDCFDALTEDLRASVKPEDGDEVDICISAYFERRLRFFLEHPNTFQLFLAAMVQPPLQLRAEIGEIRKRFDALNASILTGFLQRANLRPEFTIDEALQVFRYYQDAVNLRWMEEVRLDSPDATKHHEQECQRFVQIFLHGVLLEK